jgi:putative radical SAM enzyme (TIGR03279 family)
VTKPAAKAERPASVGLIRAVFAGSAAERIGLRAGDELLALNGQPCEDVIDVQFYGAEPTLDFHIRRDGAELTLTGERDYDQALGLDFAHPTFDIDIRRCNNLCEFCFVLQMAPRMRRTLYIKDDDYRYSFLFGHFVTLTNLSTHDWWRIKEQRLSPLYVSVHATEIEKRRECLRNPTAPDIMSQLRELVALNFIVHTQLVITPGVNDGEHMERSINDLASLWPTVRSVSVVPVGLTKHHKYGLRSSWIDEANAVLDVCERWQATLRQQTGVGFVYPTDEWYLITGRKLPAVKAYDGLALHENGLGMVRSFLDEWRAVKRKELKTFTPLVKRVTLVTATLFAPTLAGAAQELAEAMGVQVDVRAITNTKLGEGITVAGLLMGDDVIAQLGAADVSEIGDVVVLPRIMFDHPDGISLDDRSPRFIADALKRPVALADQMGDVIDAMQGKNKLLFQPGLLTPTIAEGGSPEIVREGGWAVEKYL